MGRFPSSGRRCVCVFLSHAPWNQTILMSPLGAASLPLHLRWRINLRALMIGANRCFWWHNPIPWSLLRSRPVPVWLYSHVFLLYLPGKGEKGIQAFSGAQRGCWWPARVGAPVTHTQAQTRTHAQTRTNTHARTRGCSPRPYQINEGQELPAASVGLMRGHFDGLVVAQDGAIG